MVASFSLSIALEMHFLNAQNWTFFETAFNYVLNRTV